MQDAALIDALNNTTSLELYQLAALIERLMSDPRRIVALRRDLHLGQAVRFYEARADRLLQGRIVEMRDLSLTVQATEYRGQWKLPVEAAVCGDRAAPAGCQQTCRTAATDAECSPANTRGLHSR